MNFTSLPDQVAALVAQADAVSSANAALLEDNERLTAALVRAQLVAWMLMLALVLVLVAVGCMTRKKKSEKAINIDAMSNVRGAKIRESVRLFESPEKNKTRYAAGCNVTRGARANGTIRNT